MVKPSETCSMERRLNPFPNKPWFSHVCSRSRLKTLREKKKLLVFYASGELTAIVIKFEIVVRKLFQFGRVQNLSFVKGLVYS